MGERERPRSFYGYNRKIGAHLHTTLMDTRSRLVEADPNSTFGVVQIARSRYRLHVIQEHLAKLHDIPRVGEEFYDTSIQTATRGYE
eukprot:2706990-Rhodomonas_salina.1